MLDHVPLGYSTYPHNPDIYAYLPMDVLQSCNTTGNLPKPVENVFFNYGNVTQIPLGKHQSTLQGHFFGQHCLLVNITWIRLCFNPSKNNISAIDLPYYILRGNKPFVQPLPGTISVAGRELIKIPNYKFPYTYDGICPPPLISVIALCSAPPFNPFPPTGTPTAAPIPPTSQPSTSPTATPTATPSLEPSNVATMWATPTETPTSWGWTSTKKHHKYNRKKHHHDERHRDDYRRKKHHHRRNRQDRDDRHRGGDNDGSKNKK